jgi:pyruvate formate lyase activating enzyme
VSSYALNEDGTCAHCTTTVAGRFGRFEGGFGRRRIPVRIAV